VNTPLKICALRCGGVAAKARTVTQLKYNCSQPQKIKIGRNEILKARSFLFYFNNSQGFNPVCFLNAAEK
jgi:hypothetical protein